MYKHYTKIMIIAIAMICCQYVVFSQIAVCHHTLTKSLSTSACDYTLTTLDVDAGSSDYDTLYLSHYTVNGTGPHVVTLTAQKHTGASSTCSCIINAVDVTPPVISLINHVTLLLGANHQAIVHPQDFDLGTSDQCGNYTLSMVQNLFTCDDIGENQVVIAATDAAGNVSTGNVTLNVLDISFGVTTLVCTAEVTVAILPNVAENFTADMMLEGGPYYCPNHYIMDIVENNVARPDDSLRYVDVGKILVGRVVDPSTGNSCWGQIKVVSDSCSENFTVCDTKSKCEPFGDCVSGHTNTDNIEWPCDIDEANVPHNVYADPSPEMLATYLQVPLSDVTPELVGNSECSSILLNFSETIVNINAIGKKIIRVWTVHNWLNGEQFAYTQIIKLYKGSGSCDFCDTKPWNEPVGDCASGHTLEDAVEWPADVEVNGSASLVALANNPSINSNDVIPQINTSCGVEKYFNDTYSSNGQDSIINRKWSLYNEHTFQNTEYTQKITLSDVDESNRTVCINRRNGLPIPNVLLYSGNETGTEACKTFAYDANHTMVTPTKNTTDFGEGVDIGDAILMQEYILGITHFDEFQKIAADVNQDGKITAYDVLLVSKIINGDSVAIQSLGNPWLFLNTTNYAGMVDFPNPFAIFSSTLTSFANIQNALYSYHFVGIRKGDIDDSYSATTSLPITALVLEDEILNKEESYQIPVIAKQDYRVKGIQFNLEKSNGIAFDGITSEYFNHINVKEFPTHYQISWLPEASLAMKDGLPVFSGTPLFKLNLKATKNDVMSNSLKFGNEMNNRLFAPDYLPSYQLKFDWNNVIPVGSKDLTSKKLEIYPTLVTNKFMVSFNDSSAKMEIYNLEGRLVNAQQVKSGSEIDMTQSQNGLYFVTIQYINGAKEVRKIVKE